MNNNLKVFLSALRADRKIVRECPICSWTGKKFRSGGVKTKRRYDSSCPRCGSLERHRLAYLVAEQERNLDFTQVLHVAPEKQFVPYLKEKSEDYLSIDLYTEAMAKMDVTALELDDESQTLIWISHVMEHVERDDLAIKEMFRVLKPGGVAFVQVPIWNTITFEDPSVTTEEERTKVFYQPDHVRLFGDDIVERFEQKGFRSKVVRARDFGPDRILRNGLSFISTNEVFLFKKPSNK